MKVSHTTLVTIMDTVINDLDDLSVSKKDREKIDSIEGRLEIIQLILIDNAEEKNRYTSVQTIG